MHSLFFCRWFCHFDDDNYVNVPRLVEKLAQFDHRQDWYLGKPSLPEPLEILDRDKNHQQVSLFAMCITTGAREFFADRHAIWLLLHKYTYVITFCVSRRRCVFGLQPEEPVFVSVNHWPPKWCPSLVEASLRMWEKKFACLTMSPWVTSSSIC